MRGHASGVAATCSKLFSAGDLVEQLQAAVLVERLGQQPAHRVLAVLPGRQQGLRILREQLRWPD